MRYDTAVQRLRSLAGDCHRPNTLTDEPFLVAAYTFGPITEFPDQLDVVDVAFVLNEPAEELTWETEPQSCLGVIGPLRLDRIPVRRYWRPMAWPVWNHVIVDPVRIWSPEGPDEAALDALARRDASALHPVRPSVDERERQLRVELEASFAHLRQVRAAYWDHDWRREHKGFGVYPEGHLWNAVHGYLDLLDAVGSQ